MIQLRMLVAVSVLVVSGLTLVGCSSNEVTAKKVRGDMSPNMMSVSRNGGQYANMSARSVDHTGRQAWDDFAELFLFDKPSSLSEYPIPR